MRYAQNTAVSVERSKAEIEGLLSRYGAEQFVSGWKGEQAIIGFKLENRSIRFNLPLPDKSSKEFTHTIAYETERSPEKAFQCWEQACRQRWRALALVIKAKLEAVESGITTLEEEFYANIVMPGGKTVYEMTHKNVQLAYESGKATPLLEFTK